jgi:membrane-bound inhibitor of C-type lysozyme
MVFAELQELKVEKVSNKTFHYHCEKKPLGKSVENARLDHSRFITIDPFLLDIQNYIQKTSDL